MVNGLLIFRHDFANTVAGTQQFLADWVIPTGNSLRLAFILPNRQLSDYVEMTRKFQAAEPERNKERS